MPRKPIEGNPSGLRIDLGTKERQILEDFALSYRLQTVLPNVTKILTDVSALYAIGVILETVFDIELPLITTPNDVIEFWENVRTEMKDLDPDRKEKAFSFFGGLQNLADFILATNPITGQSIFERMNEAEA
tara:strand:- start:956 stop:1351 length:396 start_codon:yes stop_codon:yes gene_type:complete